MKKSILVLSALLTLVVSGICLQSCSSEYDEYTTEEYGSYTEEEIDAIIALAEKYGLCMEINKNYYGVKRSLLDIEKDIKNMTSILGTHEMVLVEKNANTITVGSLKKGDNLPRYTTRYVEGSGSWSDSKSEGGMTVSVTISWQGDGGPNPSATGEVEIMPANGLTDSDDSSHGNVSCSFIGVSGITFTGYAYYKYFLYEETTGGKTKKEFAEFKYNISSGYLETTEPYTGSFVLEGGKSGIITEED